MIKTYNNFINNDLLRLARTIANIASKINPTFYNGGIKEKFVEYIQEYFYKHYTPEKLYAIKREADNKKRKLITLISRQIKNNVRRDFEKKNRIIITEADMPYTGYYGEDFFSTFSGNFTDSDDAKHFDENYDVSTSDDKKNKTSSRKKSSDEPRLFGKIPSTYGKIDYEELMNFISTLPEKYQRTIDLREEDEITDDEIAKELGISKRGLYKRLEKLQKLVKERFNYDYKNY